MTYGIGNPGPGQGWSQKWDRGKLGNLIQPFPFVYWLWLWGLTQLSTTLSIFPLYCGGFVKWISNDNKDINKHQIYIQLMHKLELDMQSL